MALPSGTGQENSEAGIAVFGTAVYEPDPTRRGAMRVKREYNPETGINEIVYTPESVAKFKQVEAARTAETKSVGSGITGDPVASYYAKELEYQANPERPRPSKGPHSKPMDVPAQYLPQAEAPVQAAAPEPVIVQDAPIVIPNLKPRSDKGTFVKRAAPPIEDLMKD